MMLVIKHKDVIDEHQLKEKLDLDKNKTDLKTMSYYSKFLYNKCTPIIKAIKIGNTNMVKLFLEEMVESEINAINDEYNDDTPLLCAIKENNLEMVKVLIDNNKVDVNLKGGNHFGGYPSNRMPLERALRMGVDAENVQLALINHNDINLNDMGIGGEDEWNALILAAKMCKVIVVQTLVEKGMDPLENKRFKAHNNKYIERNAFQEAFNRFVKLLNRAKEQKIPKLEYIKIDANLEQRSRRINENILEHNPITNYRKKILENLKNAYEICQYFCEQLNIEGDILRIPEQKLVDQIYKNKTTPPS